MDKNAIERLAVHKISDTIAVCDNLLPYVAENDKEPIWDGNIYLYRDNTKDNDHFIGRIPVQVKGTTRGDISKEEITYQFTKTMLKNYLTDGGVLFFVVLIDSNNSWQRKIYYIELPPIRIRSILSNLIKQKNKNVKLRSFPTDTRLIETICLNFFQNRSKQYSFSKTPYISLEELKEKGVLKSVSIPVSCAKGIDPKSVLTDGDVYLYAEIEGSNLLHPIDMIMDQVTTMEIVPAVISVEDREFYNRYRVISDADGKKVLIGDSITIVRNTEGILRFLYKASSKLNALLIDLDFLLSVIASGSFKIKENTMWLDKDSFDYSKFSVGVATENLRKIKEINQLFQKLHCSKDVDFKDFTSDDWRYLDILVRGILHNEIISDLNKDCPPIVTFPICNLKFVICMKKVKPNIEYRISDFFNTDLTFTYKRESEERISTSQYVILDAVDLSSIDNIQVEAFLPSFQKYRTQKNSFDRANEFMLKLILAYDMTKNQDFLNTAKDFAEWILNEAHDDEIPYSIRLINKFQIIKRQRKLSKDELKELCCITENNNCAENVFVGAYLLLEQQTLAEIHFDKLSTKEQEDFKKYPIYHFWEHIT